MVEEVKQVIRTWSVPGPGSVSLLAEARGKLRKEWPELAAALEELSVAYLSTEDK